MSFRLIDIAMGPGRDGRPREARGVIAIGGRAFGILAIGGIARGVVAIGGIAIGVVSLGGISIGGLAVGGMALGGFVFGGGALGYAAQGGGTIGHYACGGSAKGTHTLSPAEFFSPEGATPEALRFFSAYGVMGCKALVTSYDDVVRARAAVPP